MRMGSSQDAIPVAKDDSIEELRRVNRQLAEQLAIKEKVRICLAGL